MSEEISLANLRNAATGVGLSLSLLNIEVCWVDGKPEVFVQADLDRSSEEEFETVLVESKARTIEGALAKVKSMIEESAGAKE